MTSLEAIRANLEHADECIRIAMAEVQKLAPDDAALGRDRALLHTVLAALKLTVATGILEREMVKLA